MSLKFPVMVQPIKSKDFLSFELNGETIKLLVVPINGVEITTKLIKELNDFYLILAGKIKQDNIVLQANLVDDEILIADYHDTLYTKETDFKYRIVNLMDAFTALSRGFTPLTFKIQEAFYASCTKRVDKIKEENNGAYFRCIPMNSSEPLKII